MSEQRLVSDGAGVGRAAAGERRGFSRRKNILPDERAPETEVVRKFMDNTRYAMAPARASSIMEMILNLESIPNARTIARALTPGSG